ncbi:hypothetical protein [Nocardioides montaniterrae]
MTLISEELVRAEQAARIATADRHRQVRLAREYRLSQRAQRAAAQARLALARSL